MTKNQLILQTTRTSHAQGQSLAQGHLPVLQGQAHLALQGRGQEDAVIPALGPGNMGKR